MRGPNFTLDGSQGRVQPHAHFHTVPLESLPNQPGPSQPTLAGMPSPLTYGPHWAQLLPLSPLSLSNTLPPPPPWSPSLPETNGSFLLAIHHCSQAHPLAAAPPSRPSPTVLAGGRGPLIRDPSAACHLLAALTAGDRAVASQASQARERGSCPRWGWGRTGTQPVARVRPSPQDRLPCQACRGSQAPSAPRSALPGCAERCGGAGSPNTMWRPFHLEASSSEQPPTTVSSR